MVDEEVANLVEMEIVFRWVRMSGCGVYGQ
jgi:hypothetical protein